MKTIKLLIIFILISIQTNLYSLDKTNYYSYGNELDATTITILNKSKDSLIIKVPVRVLFDILSFEESYSDDKKSIYTAYLELELVSTDNGGIIRNRSQIKDTVYTTNYESTNSKSLYHETFFDITLAKNDYNLVLNLYTQKNKKSLNLKVKDINSESSFISESIIMYRDNAQKNLYNLSPYIIKNSALFDNNIISILCYLNNPESQYLYTIEYLTDSKNTSIYSYWESNKILIDGKAELLKNKELVFNNEFSKSTFDLKNGNDNYLKITLPFERIIPSEYKLVVKSENDVEQTIYFQVEWESKSLALDNIDYAINKMYYILTDEELEYLNEGSSSDKEKKLMEYWKKLDPTPSTPFNESMFQYFDRVDFAFFNFSTLAEKDGAETDRGKIFILNGAPDKIADKNIDGKPGIVWEYKNLKKKYYFKSVSSGIFKLIKIEE